MEASMKSCQEDPWWNLRLTRHHAQLMFYRDAESTCAIRYKEVLCQSLFTFSLEKISKTLNTRNRPQDECEQGASSASLLSDIASCQRPRGAKTGKREKSGLLIG